MLTVSSRADEQVIPIANFFSHPMATDLVISPNGKYYSAIIAAEGNQFLIVSESVGGVIKPLLKTEDPDFRIARVVWGNDDLLLISASMKSKTAVGVSARATRLYSMPREGGQRPRYLAEEWPEVENSQYQDHFLSFLRDDSESVLIQYWNPKKKWPQPVKLKLASGRLTQWGKFKENVYNWYATATGDIRVGTGFHEHSRTWRTVARSDIRDKFQPVNERKASDAVFSFAGYSDDPTHIYVVSDHENGRDALYLYDLGQHRFEKNVFSNDRVDVNELLYFETRDEPFAIGYILDTQVYEFLDPDLEADILLITQQIGRTPQIVSASADGQRIILSSSDDTHPPVYWLYDRNDRKLWKLASAYPELRDHIFQPMRAITFNARDGMKLSGYLTVPAEGTKKRWPTIVLVHGGPWARDYRRWDPEVQFFVNRGYAVLQINFRGSTGFGRDFQVAGNKQWGLAMQDDISDGVKWLIDQGVADAERICIYGTSYGGYAAIMGLIRTPDLFKCGASYAGVMDLVGQLRDDDWYIGGQVIREQIGDPRKDKKRLSQTSPYKNIDKIRVPVLLAHGEYDERVNVRQSKKMAKALEKTDKPVELYIFPSEIHGFKEESNRILFYTSLIGFFDKHLSIVGEDAAIHE